MKPAITRASTPPRIVFPPSTFAREFRSRSWLSQGDHDGWQQHPSRRCARPGVPDGEGRRGRGISRLDSSLVPSLRRRATRLRRIDMCSPRPCDAPTPAQLSFGGEAPAPRRADRVGGDHLPLQLLVHGFPSNHCSGAINGGKHKSIIRWRASTYQQQFVRRRVESKQGMLQMGFVATQRKRLERARR